MRGLCKAGHTGSWFQIWFCLAFAPAPWLSAPTVRLLTVIDYHGHRLAWAACLIGCAVALFIGIIKHRPKCRHHGLAVLSFFWLSMTAVYSPGGWYSPMTMTFGLLGVMAITTLVHDVRRKPREKADCNYG